MVAMTVEACLSGILAQRGRRYFVPCSFVARENAINNSNATKASVLRRESPIAMSWWLTVEACLSGILAQRGRRYFVPCSFVARENAINNSNATKASVLTGIPITMSLLFLRARKHGRPPFGGADGDIEIMLVLEGQGERRSVLGESEKYVCRTSEEAKILIPTGVNFSWTFAR